MQHKAIDQPSQVGYGHILKATTSKPTVKATRRGTPTHKTPDAMQNYQSQTPLQPLCDQNSSGYLLREQEEGVTLSQRRSNSENRYQPIDGLLV